ncbi:hypothetical protein H8356DRAFT_1073905 [Neocallimastix lanati (nom. inval.)]|nr:hypothetical protein H8356DRAFT_1073905 [Neocallimastix sp. JGI-2020a]
MIMDNDKIITGKCNNNMDKSHSKKTIWIYNEQTKNPLCLYTTGFFEGIISCEKCGNSDNYKWYLNTAVDDNSIQITSVLDTSTSVTPTKTTTSTPTASSIWLYNENTELCLRVFRYEDNPELCLRVDDEDESKIMMNNCDTNAIFLYNNIYKSIECKKCPDNCIDNPNFSNVKNVKNKVSLYDCINEVRDDQMWTIKNSLPKLKPTTTTIYKPYSNNPDYENGIPTYSECRNLDDYKWIITKKKEGYYFKSKSNSELCLKMADENKIIMGKYDNNAFFNYNNNYKTIMSKYYNDCCVGNEKLHSYGVAFYSVTKRSVTLYYCSEEVNDDQMLQFTTSFPRKIIYWIS